MNANHPEPVLAVEHLTTQIASRIGTLRPVDDVSFSLRPGEILGLIGESGSGKSMTALSIMGLLDPPAEIAAGKILFKGQDLRSLPQRAMRTIRGNRIAMIFQDPMMTLNPVLRIDTQLIETVLAHRNVSRAAAHDMARDALARVGIPSPEERLRAYPHEFSGGMRQRVAIAIALLNQPDLVICDEPTTALDVTIQSQILRQMEALCRDSGTALIWITHDLSVVAGFADQVAVMYAGKIVEHGPVDQVLRYPCHPYTHGLVASVPSRNPHGQPLRQIAGAPPALGDLPAGCAFRDRCPNADGQCRALPELTPFDGRLLRCFHPMADAP